MIKHYLLFLLSLYVLHTQAQVSDSASVIKDSIRSIAINEIQDSLAKQETKPKIQKGVFILEGEIKDYTTAEPLQFATIYFAGTSIGTKTDIEGKFKFNLTKIPKDSITISLIGYGKKSFVIDTTQPYQRLKFEMERNSISLRDFVIVVEKNPGLALIKKVIKNKSRNNMDKANNYSYEVYNKLEMDINKIPKKAFKQSPLLKKFDFVQQYIDSTSEEKPFLPLFLTETISDYYFQRKPSKMKEFIKGSRISGYKNESVSKMLGSMYQNINIYENQIPIFDVSFVSPIANNAPSFYRYEIIDTQIINGRTCYQVAFTPKRNGEHTFNGDCWIHDTDYAVQRINMIVTKAENVNWVNKVTMLQEFDCLEDSMWFLTKDKFYVDFLPPHGDKVAGFLGRKTTTYKNIVVNSDKNEAVLSDKKNKDDTYIDPEATSRNEDYWNSVRHDSLSKNEKAIYQMIDTIQHLPIYKKYYTFFYFVGTGLIEAGPLELGSFYSIVSKNVIEGTRLKIPLGTTPKLFKNIYLRGYLAYGLRDERWKYYASMLWILKRNPRMYLFAEYKRDVDNSVSTYDETRSFDNIFSTLGRKKNVPWKLGFTERERIEFYNSYFNGFSHQLFVEQKSFTPYAPLPSQDIVPSGQIQSTEVGIDFRFAYKEEFVEGNYYRTSLGTKYPIVHLFLSQGIKNNFGGDYSYSKLRFSVSDYLKLATYGSLYYNVFAGKTFGTLPYPLLEIHPGNEFFYYNTRAFNMMYRYEYISDQYIGFNMEHSMGSLFFKYIPYVNKMKIRTFWNAKGVYGGLSTANAQLNLNRGYTFNTLRNPYLEVGTGLENILKVLRVDFVWRVLPMPSQDVSLASRFGIFGSMKFSF